MTLSERFTVHGTSRNVTIRLNDRTVEVPSGCSLAAALTAVGLDHFRTTPVSGQSRGPYCMMGVCFECLLEVDGRTNVQSCLLPVRQGMEVRIQHGARTLGLPTESDDQGQR